MSSVLSKNSSYLETVRKVLDIEASAISKLKSRLDNNLDKALKLILACDHRVILTGIGKSGIICKKIAATFASTGTPSLFLHPAEASHGDLGMVTKKDLIIAISNSGETEELLKIVPSIKRIGAKIISITSSCNSTLARKSDVSINIGKFEEACPLGLAPTTTTTVTLALGDAMAVSLLEAKNFKKENFALFHPGGSLGRRLLICVNDIVRVTKKNPVIHYDTNIKNVLFKITESGLGAISIVNDEGDIIGILTDGDIRRALTKGNDILDSSVEEYYTKTPIIIHLQKLAVEALKLMEDNKINVLPVVNDEKKPVGMLHIQDLTKLGLL